MKELTFGADGTEVVWFAELTEAMVENIVDYDDNPKLFLEELFLELNKAVEAVCLSFGVK
jgi:hypothetical protein